MQVESNGANFTVTSGSNIVTCTTCHFKTSTFHTAAVGDVIFATNWTGTDANYQTAVAVIGLGSSVPITITSVDSDTQVHISVNAGGNAGTTNANNGSLPWGPDDTAAIHLAKIAAYDQLNCASIRMPGPISIIDGPEFNTAACRGISGGSTASKYTGVFGENPSGNTTFLLPPWFALGTIANCNGASSGTACFGGAGGFFNVTFNGLGQSSFALGAHNLLENANDVSYNNVYLWGFAAASAGSQGIVLNTGIHIVQNIIVDGVAATPCAVPGLVHPVFSLECLGGTSANGNLNVIGNLICFNCNIQTGQNSGIGVGVQSGGTYWGYGDSFFNFISAGNCWAALNGGILHIDGGTCPNSFATNSTAITNVGTGFATIRNSTIQGGATTGAFSIPTTATLIYETGNKITANGPGTSTGILTNLPVGSDVQTGKTTAQAAKTLFTVGTNNTVFTAYGSVACDSTSAAATVLVTFLYTDVSNTAQTVASAVATCTTLGAASTNSINTSFMAKAGTAIQYSTTIASTPTYDVRVTLQQTGLN
jgi:hypothetical protein